MALRRGIDGLTVRAVAARAAAQPRPRPLPLQAEGPAGQRPARPGARDHAVAPRRRRDRSIGGPRDRLRALLRQEVDRLSRDPRRIRLFLEYWALGAHRRASGERSAPALERYRAAFRKLAEEVLHAEGARFPGVTPEGLAAIAVSFINGYRGAGDDRPRPLRRRGVPGGRARDPRAAPDGGLGLELAGSRGRAESVPIYSATCGVPSGRLTAVPPVMAGCLRRT